MLQVSAMPAGGATKANALMKFSLSSLLVVIFLIALGFGWRVWSFEHTYFFHRFSKERILSAANDRNLRIDMQRGKRTRTAIIAPTTNTDLDELVETIIYDFYTDLSSYGAGPSLPANDDEGWSMEYKVGRTQ